MNVVQMIVVAACWLAWTGYWIYSARGLKQTVRRESDASRFWQSLPMMLGGALILLPDVGLGLLDARYAPAGDVLRAQAGYAIIIAGLLMTVWARRCLGANWSVSVTLKQDHSLVRAGPYRLTRHPIYTWGLFALVGSALVGGEWRGLVGVVLIAGSLIYKIQIEERWLGEYFGDSYGRYRREVRALIPLIY